MHLVARFGIAAVLCLAMNPLMHAVLGAGASASIPLAGSSAAFPRGSVRIYRTGADPNTLRPLDPRTLADLPGPALHTGVRPHPNDYPAVVATSNGAEFAVMANIHPNGGRIRARDLTLQLFDAGTGAPISSAHHPAAPVWIDGISADGSVVYGFGVYSDPNLPCALNPFYLLDARTGRVIRRLTIAEGPGDSILVGPNLQRLYTMSRSDHVEGCGPRWSYSPTITAYDLRTGRMVRALRLKGVPAGRWETSRSINGEPIGGDWTPGFALSPDGSQIAVLDGRSDTLLLLRAQSLRVERRESVVRPQTGLEALAALLGLQPAAAEAKGQWNGETLQMQYTPDGRSLLVTGARLRPDKRHLYASSRFLGIRLIDIATGRIRAWLDDGKQVLGIWPAPDGSAVYSAVQGWSRPGGWLTTLRRLDPATLRVRARRTFRHMGNWWLDLVFLQGRG